MRFDILLMQNIIINKDKQKKSLLKKTCIKIYLFSSHKADCMHIITSPHRKLDRQTLQKANKRSQHSTSIIINDTFLSLCLSSFFCMRQAPVCFQTSFCADLILEKKCCDTSEIFEWCTLRGWVQLNNVNQSISQHKMKFYLKTWVMCIKWVLSLSQWWASVKCCNRPLKNIQIVKRLLHALKIQDWLLQRHWIK